MAPVLMRRAGGRASICASIPHLGEVPVRPPPPWPKRWQGPSGAVVARRLRSRFGRRGVADYRSSREGGAASESVRKWLLGMELDTVLSETEALRRSHALGSTRLRGGA